MACALCTGGDVFCAAAGMVLQVAQQPELACKRVLVIASHEFEKVKNILGLNPHLNPTKQDTEWPGSQAFGYEHEAAQRRQSIKDALRRENIEYEEITLQHGDRYTTWQQLN